MTKPMKKLTNKKLNDTVYRIPVVCTHDGLNYDYRCKECKTPTPTNEAGSVDGYKKGSGGITADVTSLKKQYDLGFEAGREVKTMSVQELQDLEADIQNELENRSQESMMTLPGKKKV